MTRWLTIAPAFALIAAVAIAREANLGSQTVTWDAARSSAWAAYVLLWLAAFTGIGVSLKYHPGVQGQLQTLEMHRVAGSLALAYTIVHVGALLLDPYIDFAPWHALLPLTSPYRPVPVAAGVVATWLLLAVVLSTWFAGFIPRKTWHRLHRVGYAAFALGLVHGVAAGSDTDQWPTHLLYTATAASVIGAAYLRFLARDWVAAHRNRPQFPDRVP